jgi:hypothetical protein
MSPVTARQRALRVQNKNHLPAFIFSILSLFVGLAFAQDNPPARVARISYLKGKVSFLPSGQDQWSEATLNFTVTTGDRIYTEKDARAELQVGSYTVRLAGETDLTVTNLNDQMMQFGLEQGTLRVSVYELSADNTVEVDTPNGAITALAPGIFRVQTDPDGDHTLVAVNSGSVHITNGDVAQKLEAGQALRLSGQDPVQAESVPMPASDNFDQWCMSRDQRMSASASAQYVSPATPGFDDLDEYGHWRDVADYGPVWYPDNLPPDWVPYRLGHWAWIDPWGWTWVDEEVWGFCPFHYGRWVLIRAAWGWLPGPIVALPVFAPAFVAFVGGPGFAVGIGAGLVAWFPLGPGEPFFPWYHYTVDYLQAVNITNIRNATNITNITNINDVHYKYKTVAATAVPAHAFSNGEPVRRAMVPVRPEQLARAQVTPHPPVNPTPRAAAPGRPVPRPPVRAQHFPVVARPGAVTAHGGVARAGGPVGAQPRVAPPRLITRSAPPPPRVPFVQERPVLAEHPGRPLEPQQIENLRAGRPPGEMRDHEFPSHPVPVVRERVAAAPPPVAPPPSPGRHR